MFLVPLKTPNTGVFVTNFALNNVFLFLYLYWIALLYLCNLCICILKFARGTGQPKLECAQAKLAELLSHGQGRLFLLHLCTPKPLELWVGADNFKLDF